MYTLDDLKQLKTSGKENDDQEQVDRAMYMKGRASYPSAPPSELNTRERGCYMMGFKTSEALTINEHIGCEW